jgi:hypothetical protein
MNRYADWRLDCFETGTTHWALTTRLSCKNGDSLGVQVLKLKQWFLADHLEVERLLSEWRWLCPHRMALVARTAFGDLFLRNEAGIVFWLNTAVGQAD